MSEQTAQDEITRVLFEILNPGGAPEPGLAAIGITGVYNFRGVPQPTNFDYVTLGDAQEKEDDTFDQNGSKLMYTVHIYSLDRGTYKVNALIKRIKNLIHRQDLDLIGYKHVYSYHQRSGSKPERNGTITHGAVQFEIFTQEEG